MKCARRAISAMTAPHSALYGARSRLPLTTALDGATHKLGETLALWPVPRQAHRPQEGFTNENRIPHHLWGKPSGFCSGLKRGA